MPSGAASSHSTSAGARRAEAGAMLIVSSEHHHAHDGLEDHAHRHGAELSEMQLRVRARDNPRREGLHRPAARDRLIETYETRIGSRNGARVVAKAWPGPDGQHGDEFARPQGRRWSKTRRQRHSPDEPRLQTRTSAARNRRRSTGSQRRHRVEGNGPAGVRGDRKVMWHGRSL